MNPHSDPYIDQPREVSLETWAKCNAACTFCPYPTMERIGDKMSDEMIERLITEMESFEHPFYFSPFKVNEPLLDKRTIPMCREVLKRTKGIIRLFTNGSALTPKNIREIAELDRVVHLWISLNDYRPKEYKELMNLDFENTAEKLDYLHESDFPHQVMLSTVGYPNERFRFYCHERWPKFDSMAIQKSGWLGEIDGDDIPVPDRECARWWELSIMASGKVALCCMDSEGKFSIGDLNEQTLKEVYRANKAARIHRKRNFHPCETCNYG